MIKREIALKAKATSLIVLAVPIIINNPEIFVEEKTGRVLFTYTDIQGVSVKQAITDTRKPGRYDLIGTFSDVDTRICEFITQTKIEAKEAFQKILIEHNLSLKSWFKKPLYNTEKEVLERVSADVLVKHYIDEVRRYNSFYDEFMFILKTT